MADLSSLLADAGQPCGQPLPDVDSLGILDDLWWSSGAELTPSGLGAPPAAAPSAPAADTELDKRRAQNRAAMQRFRQRQRQRQQEQQQRREEQADELERARMEHQAAVSEHAVLEASHSLRDDWMETLRLLREAHAAEAAAGQIAGDTCSASVMPVSATAGQTAAAAPASHSSSSSSGAGDSHAALQLAEWLEAAARSGGQQAASGQYVPTLAAAIAALLRTSPHTLAAVRALTPAQLVALWDRLLERVAELLAVVEAAGCKQAERQLTDLMIESCLFLDLVTLLQPNHFKLLVATRSLAPQPDEGVHAQWQAVVSTLCLTPAQLRGLRAEWQAFLAIQAQLAGAANAAAAGVAAAAPAQTPQCATGSQQLPSPAAAAAAVEQPAASMAAQVERYVQLAERVGELAAAADAHWAALLAFSDATWYMLTPLQGARLLAACRPFYPDPIQLVRALLEAEVEEAGGGEVASTGVAWSWRRQAAEHQRGSGALRSGMFPSNLLSL